MADAEPRANYFGNDPTGVPTPAVISRAHGDLYLTLINIDSVGIRLQADTSPLIWLLWVGGLVVAAGGFWSMTIRRAVPSRSATQVPSHG